MCFVNDPLQLIIPKEVYVRELGFEKKLSNLSNHRLKKARERPQGREERAAEPGLQPLSSLWQLFYGRLSLKACLLIKKRQISQHPSQTTHWKCEKAEEVEVLETCLYFYSAQMPSVTFHSEPLGTAKVYSPFRRHKHSFLQPFQDRQGNRRWRTSSLGKEYTQKISSFRTEKYGSKIKRAARGNFI